MIDIPKNTGKAPSMQFYPADWRQDNGVQALDYHDRGVWFEMICIMHSSQERGVLSINGAAMSREMIARLLGLDNQTFNQTISKLLTYGVARERETDKAIYSKRMVNDEKLSQLRRNAGKLGGNPSLLNQNPTSHVNQNPTPSASASASASTPIPIPDSDSVIPPAPRPRKKAQPITAEWLTEIESAFPHTSPKSEFAKAKLWCDAKNRTCSRAFMLNWLGRIPPPPQFAQKPSASDPSRWLR